MYRVFFFRHRAILTALIICFLIQHARAQDISVSPIAITFDGVPGQTVSEVITMSNGSSTKTYDFVSSLSDWSRDSLGNRHYAEAGSMKNSNANWVKLVDNSFSIAPGEKKKVIINFDIPTDLKDKTALNSMLFLTQTNPDETSTDQASIGIKISYEYGIQLFYNPLGASKGDMELEKIDYYNAAEQEKGHKLVVKFNNDGYINKTGFIRVELTKRDSGEEIKLDPQAFAIMPKDDQIMTIPLSADLEPGDYFAVVILDAGRDYNLKVAKKTIHVK